MNLGTPEAADHVLAQVQGNVGVLTLNRPAALNALSLEMIRQLSAALVEWSERPEVVAVVVRGAGREGRPPAFCAGGDIRFFHRAALSGDPRLEDFFTEEYSLNHLIHHYPKPYIALMDGVVMGGGMGISQGGALRVVTERSRLAMPETNIGLFPDVGGGWFLARCPGHVGEFLGVTGQSLQAADAIAFGLADEYVPSVHLPGLIESLTGQPHESGEQALAAAKARAEPVPPVELAGLQQTIDRHFCAPTLSELFKSLRDDASDWARSTLEALGRRSPLMMAVTLEQIRRARHMTLADDLRMERGLVRHCFHLRAPAESETVEGIRALAVDKDHQPRWHPRDVDEVTADMVAQFFDAPWPPGAHPLRALA